LDRSDSVTALVLAAGASSRMGSPKALLRWQGTTLLRHVASVALESACDEVVVVLGSESERLRRELGDLPVHIAETQQWREGMSASLRAGVEAATLQAPGCGALLVLLVDQPHVSPQLIEKLLAARSRTGLPMAACAYSDTLGPPALFDRSLFPALLELTGDRGAKSLLLRDPADVAPVSFPEGARDLDTPADLQKEEGG
jgi:molybdenum cofactor cytidylyltransferase